MCFSPSAPDRGPLQARRKLPTNASGLHEGTAALVERAERVFGLDRRDELEIVPIVFRFVRGLGSVEIHRVELAPSTRIDPLPNSASSVGSAFISRRV